MTRIKALRFGADGASEVEHEAPALTGDDVLIKVLAAPFGAPELAATKTSSPHTLGGAAIGRVVEAAPAATDFIGARVVLGPDQSCGECDDCRGGFISRCGTNRRLGDTVDGTLASHVVARGRWLCRVDGAIDLERAEAAILGREALAAYGAYASASVSPGDSTIVIGNDVSAILLASILELKGARAQRVAPDSSAAELDAWFAQADPARGLHVFSPASSPLRGELLERRELVATDTGMPGHPDLIPELAALVARGELDLASRVEVIEPGTDTAELETRARELLARGQVLVLRIERPPT